MRRSLLVLLTAVLVLPATASAKLTRLPGTGETPVVEVDAAGTALVAWYLQQPSGEAIALCRIPRGHARVPGAADSRRHARRHFRGAAAGAADRRPERVAGCRAPVRRVDAVGRRRGDVRPDGADQLGHVLHRRDRRPTAPSRSATGRDSPRRGSAGRSRRRSVDLNPGFGAFQSVGFADGRPVYVSGGRAPRTAVSRWTGRGDIFDPSTWTRRRGPAMVYYDLDDGPRGLWLVHERRRGLDDDVVVRRWSAAASGPRARSRGLRAT